MVRDLKWMLGFACLLLCQCATKHQPVYFPAHFSEGPDGGYKRTQFAEMSGLETLSDATKFQKKRLWELYRFEARAFDPMSAQATTLSLKADQLEPDSKEITDKLDSIKEDFLKERLSTKSNEPAQNPELKKAVLEIRKIWNQDKNAESWVQMTELLARQKDFSASKEEWAKIHAMRFRVACDLGEREKMELAYQEMKAFDECHAETTQAGFLTALKDYVEGQKEKALEILQKQCDADTTSANLLKRRYWLWRLSDGKIPLEFVEADKNTPLYPYYGYLAATIRKEPFQLELGNPDADPLMASLPNPLETSGRVAKLWTLTELSLAANLRTDAKFYALRASQILSKDPDDNAPALVYTAVLLRACGHHLEAMRILNDLFALKSKQEVEGFNLNLKEVTGVLFPRPHVEKVDWFARTWKVDPDHMYALMRQESAFNPTVVSPAGARGLLQLMPELARALSRQWKLKNAYNDDLLFRVPENLKLASFHLQQLKRWGPHFVLMTAAYNAGHKRVRNWWDRFGKMPIDFFNEFIPAGETRMYVKLVLRNYLYYRSARHEGKIEPGLIPLELP